MQTKFGRLVQAVEGLRGFIMKYADALPRTAASGARRQLDALGEMFRVETAAQDARLRQQAGYVERKETLRRALFQEHLAPIVAAAKVLRTQVPNLGGVRLPKDGLSIPRLLAAARGIAESTAPFSEQLIAVGLDAQFVAKLREAADALEVATYTARTFKASRVNATKALKAGGKEAVDVARLLDRMIRVEVGHDTPAFAEWKSLGRKFGVRANQKGEAETPNDTGSAPTAA